MEAWPSTTLPIMSIVYSMQGEIDSSRVLRYDVLVALEDITML